MAALTKEQRNVLRRALRVADKKGASPREKKALVQALGVESNYRDVSYGDRDSVGALQQRPSQGWGPASESLETDVAQFLAAARKANKGNGSAGQLAQAVQRSAFPERYDQRTEADDLIRKFSRGGGPTATTGRPGSGSSRTKSTPVYQTQPAVSREEDRKALKLGYLAERGKPGALLGLKQGLDEAQDIPEKRIRVGTNKTVTNTIRESGGSGDTSGGSKAGKGSALKELFHDPVGGWKGKTNIGPIGGHGSHIHVAAGPKTVDRISREAERFGLVVRENPGFDPVERVHTQGSYHYSDRAADISGDPKKMRAFTNRLRRRYGLR